MCAKKALAPVIAVALFLVLAVFSIVFFQNWFNNYSNNILNGVEISSSNGVKKDLVIEKLIGNRLFLNNYLQGNLINSVKFDGLDCSISSNFLNLGINELTLEDCLETNFGNLELVVETSNNIYSKLVYFPKYTKICRGTCSDFEIFVDENKLVGEVVSFQINYSTYNLAISGENLTNSEIGEVIWRKSLVGEEVKRIFVEDLDNDGNNEIILEDGNSSSWDNGDLFVFDNKGNLLGQNSAPYRSHKTLGIGDVDGDGEKEIVNLYDFVDKGIDIYNMTLGKEKYLAGKFDNGVLVDFDDDGILEIFAYDGDNDGINSTYYDSNDNYSIVYNVKTDNSDHYTSYCGIIDRNKNGQGDTLMFKHSYGERVYGFDFFGNIVINFTPPGDTFVGGCRSGDFDEDGFEDEMIFMHFSSTFSILNSSEDLILSKGVDGGEIYGEVIDFDKDGFKDDFLTYDTENNFLIAYDNSINQIWSYTFPNLVTAQIGDLNNDGENDVIATNKTNVVILNLNGTLRKNFDLKNVISFSEIKDINNDGLNDIVYGVKNGMTEFVVFQEVDCRIDFSDGSYPLKWNDISKFWEVSRAFSSSGSFNYNVTCFKGGYETQTDSGVVIIS